MNLKRLYQVIRGPHTTEKTVNNAEKHRQVAFKVSLDANKLEIKKAVETLFKVDVTAVQVVRMKGKKRQFKQVPGKKSDWKKAYVSLKEGQDINLANYQ